jgi:predicted nucleotidyltransferase
MNGDKQLVVDRLGQDYMTVTDMGYKVFGVFLQGSQNYDLDYDGSDIDTKCIIIPKFEDIVLKNNPVSTTHINPDNSHVDLKDIRLMWDCFKKQNINFLEILFTDYYIVNSQYEELWNKMRLWAEDIAHYNNYASVNCIAGMVMEKNAALCHPYPTLKDKIDKYGYDNKQLHHIIRCEEFLERYIDGVPYRECLKTTQPNYLIEVKSTYKYSLEEAKHIAKTSVERVKAIKDKYMNTVPIKVNKLAEEAMQQVLIDTLKKSFMEDMNDE